jgi:hypothetical protein
VAIDPRKLRPSELCRLLNSTALGEVINERQLHRHRTRAGLNISDGSTIDLLRYVNWLVLTRHSSKPEAEGDPYDALKERARARNLALSQAGRDIGELPAVVNPERKARAAADFRFFCESYFQTAFYLSWSEDHFKVIRKIERAVRSGGLFAHAMPRGSGKSTLTTVAAVWAMLFGWSPFVSLIAASADRARSLLDNIKTWFETNQLLLDDFPEAIYPIRKLGRITNRQQGQTYRNEPTRIEWNADYIVLPTIPGSLASGAIMTTSGMKGSEIRGQNHVLANGTILRPRLAIIDDPQTTESAWSLSQCRQREHILASDILGMAGPDQKIAALVCCTVIRPGDMADNLLDRDKHPEWYGERTKMIYSFPIDDKLWGRYAEMRKESLRNDGDGHEATAFYRDNREAMDVGADVAWPERSNSDEISALQHAMNLKLRDEAAFWAEYQNEPLADETSSNDELTADQIADKLNRLAHCTVPISATRLTAFIDVQATLLYYVVAAWTDEFTGYVIDYGTYPDQQRAYFTLRDARFTLALATKASGLEGQIYDGLETITRGLLGRPWLRDDGAAMRIERCLIDANWGQSTDVVYEFCRQSAHASIVMPSHGKFVGASSRPLTDRDKKPGERIGWHWYIPLAREKRGIRHVIYDTNFWKSFIHARLAVAMGDRGCLSLFGDKPERHRLFAEHLCAEYRVKVEARGRTVDEWKIRAEHVDNHWYDGICAAAVAASMQGSNLDNVAPVPPQKKLQCVNYAEMYRQARERDGMR